MSDRARLEELLVKRAVEKLSVVESEELDALEARLGPDSLLDEEAIETAAAAICLAWMSSTGLEPLPDGVRARVEADTLTRLRGGDGNPA